MPGGLTRVTASLDSLVVSMQHGGGSKDTWVLADAPAPHFSLLRSAAGPLPVSRATFDLPSRVADNLYWLGRYLERFEAAARARRACRDCTRRLIRGIRPLRVPPPSTSARFSEGWRVAAGRVGGQSETSLEPRPVCESDHSIANRNANLRAGARVRSGAWRCLLRDRISADAWRVLKQLDTAVHRNAAARTAARQLGAGSARPRGDFALRVQRPRHREHDPRPRLALPRHGPPPGTRRLQTVS